MNIWVVEDKFNIKTFANHVDDLYNEVRVWQNQIILPLVLSKSRWIAKIDSFHHNEIKSYDIISKNNFAFRTAYPKISPIQQWNQKLRLIYNWTFENLKIF